jgi:formate/nitrite transporter FocA (FNT family)
MATQQSNPPTALGPPRGLRAVVVGNIIGGLVVAGLCTGGTRAGSLHQAVR